MSTEELEVVEKNEEVKKEVEPQEEQQHQLSDIEKKALELGWNPNHEGDDFIEAAEFVRRQPLFDKIERIRHENRELKKTQQQILEHLNKIKATGFRQAIDEIKQRYVKALEEGNAKEAADAQEELAEAKLEEKRFTEARSDLQVNNEIHPDLQAWMDKNPWYKTNKELFEAANRIGESYHAKNPDVPPQEVLKVVERQIKSIYKEHFDNPNKSSVSMRSKSGSTPKKENDDTDVELSPMEQQVMRDWVRQGIMTEKEYKQSIKAQRG